MELVDLVTIKGRLAEKNYWEYNPPKNYRKNYHFYNDLNIGVIDKINNIKECAKKCFCKE